MRIHAAAVILVMLAILSGCNTLSGVPEMRHASITPAELKPGDTALMVVEVKDKHALIDRIEGVVAEDPRIKFQLRDDGAAPDASLGDGIWTLQVDVPPQAEAGTYTLEFTAFCDDGTAVPVRVGKGRGKVVPLKEKVPVVIVTP